jgi:hypothetical protein
MKLKRILSCLLILSFTLLPFHQVRLVESANVESSRQPIASGTVTAANMRISAVDGTAFVDFTAADVLTGKLGSLLVIKDSAGAAIQGFIKAAGTGETKAAAKDVDGITKANPGVLTLAAGHGYGNGMLVYFSGLTEMTSLNTKYRTLYGNSGDTFSIGDTSTYEAAETTGGNCVEKLLTPSATGVTIVSAKGGTTYNFTNKSALFNYASATFTYQIYRTPAVVVASGTVTQANFHADTTADNSFVELVGVDLTAYQTGSYMIGIYNVTGGYGMLGHISATAPAGETLSGTELMPNPTFDGGVVGWACVTGTLASIAGGQSNNCLELTRTSGVSQNAQSTSSAMTVGRLNKMGGYVKSGTSGNETYSMYFNNHINTKNLILKTGTSSGSWVLVAGYATVEDSGTASAGVIKGSATAGTMLFDEFSIQQVTDPPSTGARIVSTKGGATRAWFYRHASFDPNQTNGVTYKVYYLGS